MITISGITPTQDHTGEPRNQHLNHWYLINHIAKLGCYITLTSTCEASLTPTNVRAKG